MIGKDSVPTDCHVFTLSDLPKEEREAAKIDIEKGGPGSYDDVLGRLNELADGVLPECVDKQTPEKNACREAK